MNRLLQWISIPGLLLVSISASLFMIIESGAFYQKLYQTDSSFLNMGYWAAGLNEIFMAIMAGIRLPDIKKSNQVKINPVNFFFKFLLVLLFVTTVGGASFNVIVPIMNDIQSQRNNEEIIHVLQTQVSDNEKSLETFARQNQKTNSVLSVRSQVRTKEELKNTIRNRTLVFYLWFELVFVVVLRFGVQLANLSCIWLAGWILRFLVESSPKPLVALKEQAVRPVIRKNNGQEENTNVILPAGNTINRMKDGLESGHVKNVRREAIEKPSKTAPKKTILEHTEKRFEKTGSELQNHRRIHVQPRKILAEEDERVTADLKEIYHLRKKISTLLQSRNDGIAFSEICRIIGERESKIRDIVTLKNRMGNKNIPFLESILHKIEDIYEKQHAI